MFAFRVAGRSSLREAPHGASQEPRRSPGGQPGLPAAVPPPVKRGSAWRFVLLLAVLVVGAGVVLLYKREGLSERLRLTPEASAVRTAEVRSGTLERTLRLTGTTAAEHSAFLRAPFLRGRRGRTGGGSDFRLTLRELAQSGTSVRAGDTVAVFDRQYMLDRLDDYRARLEEREASFNNLASQLSLERWIHEQDIRVARASVDRASLDLKTAPVRSAIDVELLKLDFEESQERYNALLNETEHVDNAQAARMRAAQLELQEDEVEYRRAEANTERLVVRAPRDGLVVIRETIRSGGLTTIRAGDELRPGHLYGQVVDPGSMIVEAQANQVDVEQLRIGALAQVRFDALPGLELPARVFSVGSLARGSGRLGSYYMREVPVFLDFERTDPKVIPSLSASADVVLEREEGVEIIPREAVFVDEQAGTPYALVESDGGWERRDLEVGLADHSSVAVLSGLELGEIVATEMPAPTGG